MCLKPVVCEPGFMVSSRYFSMPFPLPKLDLVAVPEFSAGAMENYGLIVYRENELLYDPLHSTTARKQRVGRNILFFWTYSRKELDFLL